jgi:hypothetical protein
VDAYFYGHVHEGFARERVGDTEFVKTATALEGAWMRVTTDGTTFDVSACRFDDCDVEPLLDTAPGVTPPEGEIDE